MVQFLDNPLSKAKNKGPARQIRHTGSAFS